MLIKEIQFTQLLDLHMHQREIGKFMHSNDTHKTE